MQVRANISGPVLEVPVPFLEILSLFLGLSALAIFRSHTNFQWVDTDEEYIKSSLSL